MHAVSRQTTVRHVAFAIAAASLVVAAAGYLAATRVTARVGVDIASPGAPGAPYATMPTLAPIGVRVDRYLDVPPSAQGPTIDPAKGYRTERLGDGLYMVTDGAYQSMFMTYERGVVVVDAPPSYAARLRQAIADVSAKPITHLVYSHYHSDHIGGTRTLGGEPIIIAHRETNRLLERAADADRPVAAVTFDDHYRLEVGSQVLELSYHGVAHAPGNIFIHAPKQRTLMVVDVIFPGWMPWRRFAVAQDVPGYFAQVETISGWSFDTLVGGHVGRTGTPADVLTQRAFMHDLKTAAQAALKTTVPAEGMAASDRGNPWAVFDHYIDRVAVSCVNQLTPKWSHRLAAYDVYIWDQCYSMEQSLRID